MTKRGFLLGKFMPPHAGHLSLIRAARALVDELTVLVCWLPRDPIPGETRLQWMRALAPDCRVVGHGEIVPQAYFSRHAMRMGALLSPLVRFYQFVLFPVAKPSAMILDGWIGPEGPSFLRERNMEIFLQRHIHDEESDIGAVEGRGALNFLSLDDRKMATEGMEIAPESVLSFPSGVEGPSVPGQVRR